MSKCINESVAVCCNCRIALHQSAKQRAAQSAKCSRKISDLRENGTSKFVRKPTMRIVCGFNPPSEAEGKRPARERDFQVCAKPTTRIACSFKRVPSKIIHRIIFEFAPYKQSALEPLLSCKRGSNFRKYAWTDKSFSLVATSAQRRCLWTPRAFCKKLDQKLLYICHTTRLCAVGE